MSCLRNKEDISIYIFSFLFLITAAIQDFRCFKVSNDLIFLGYSISFIYQCIYQKNIYVWVTGISVSIILLFGLFCLKMLGAGDIKVISVLSGFYGWNAGLQIFILALFYGAVWSVFKIILYRNGKERFGYFFQYLKHIKSEKKCLPYRSETITDKTCTIPFTVVILIAYATFFVREGGVL